jgi:hypothetical protein
MSRHWLRWIALCTFGDFCLCGCEQNNVILGAFPLVLLAALHGVLYLVTTTNLNTPKLIREESGDTFREEHMRHPNNEENGERTRTDPNGSAIG